MEHVEILTIQVEELFFLLTYDLHQSTEGVAVEKWGNFLEFLVLEEKTKEIHHGVSMEKQG